MSLKSVSQPTAAAQAQARAQAAHALELEAGATTFLVGCAKVVAKKLGAALGLGARGIELHDDESWDEAIAELSS